MNLLLDTHMLLWWLGDTARLTRREREAIADAENTVYLSAVVVWEIRIKQALGKVRLPERFRRVVDAEPLVELPMTVAHAHAVGELPSIHRDPFDRMLVAQASCEGFTIVTRDPTIPGYPVSVLKA